MSGIKGNVSKSTTPDKDNTMNNAPESESVQPVFKDQYLDLDYLYKITKLNPEMMQKMISLYLSETPRLLENLGLGIKENDWDKIYHSVHKMIPTFKMIGLDQAYEDLAKKIQQHALNKAELNEVEVLYDKIKLACSNACKKLKDTHV